MEKLVRGYLEGTKYKFCDASDLSIFEIQDLLRECRIDNNLVVFVSKTKKSAPFFGSLRRFELDKQGSNYYICHSRNYAVWVNEDEIDKGKLSMFLEESGNVDMSVKSGEGERVV